MCRLDSHYSMFGLLNFLLLYGQLLGEIAAVSTCEESLVELGVPVLVRDNYLAIVRAIRCFANDLPLEGAQYLGVNPHRLQLVSAKVLAQQLYAYLVRWTGELKLELDLLFPDILSLFW